MARTMDRETRTAVQRAVESFAKDMRGQTVRENALRVWGAAFNAGHMLTNGNAFRYTEVEHWANCLELVYWIAATRVVDVEANHGANRG